DGKLMWAEDHDYKKGKRRFKSDLKESWRSASPGKLDVDGEWRTDGPLLPVEFARQSSNGPCESCSVILPFLTLSEGDSNFVIHQPNHPIILLCRLTLVPFTSLQTALATRIRAESRAVRRLS